jgi:peptidoglycan/xylan/chitin deacetylase (PgdA/CDA1 family)
VRVPWILPPTHCPASWETIAAAAKEGLSLGVHSATHKNLTRLSRDELKQELVDSRVALAEHTGHLATTFAYPYGLADTFVRDAVVRAGYTVAATLDFGLNDRGADPLMLRRVNVPGSISLSAFQAWCAGIRPHRND